MVRSLVDQICLFDSLADSPADSVMLVWGMHEKTQIKLSATDRAAVKAVVANRNSPQKHVWRAKIVLLTAAGHGTAEIVRRTGKAKTVIWRWQERFGSEGAAGLWRDKTRPSRIPRAHGLQPQRMRQFKLSNDPQCVAKLRDIVGLYANPPDHAVVLSVDEKSQIQARDRTQPGLPMKKGRAATITHDYKRHGTTTLFAAFDVLEGKVIGQCMKRHRHQEFIRFLNLIDARVPTQLTVHVIVDNYAAHKHPKVLEWLARHPRFVFHFTPTSASWLNAVEGLFALLAKRRLKRGVFRSLKELTDAIHSFIADTNANPKPFIWTKDPGKIIAAVKRGHQVLDSIH